MRPTHITSVKESQLVGANESHDNDVLPAYHEIVNTTIDLKEEKKDLDEKKFMPNDEEKFTFDYENEKDEKSEKFFDDEKKEEAQWLLTDYSVLESARDSSNNVHSLNRGKTIAKIAAVVYIFVAIILFFTVYGGASHQGCMM
jgi:hypothetical protein